MATHTIYELFTYDILSLSFAITISCETKEENGVNRIIPLRYESSLREGIFL